MASTRKTGTGGREGDEERARILNDDQDQQRQRREVTWEDAGRSRALATVDVVVDGDVAEIAETAEIGDGYRLVFVSCHEAR